MSSWLSGHSICPKCTTPHMAWCSRLADQWGECRACGYFYEQVIDDLVHALTERDGKRPSDAELRKARVGYRYTVIGEMLFRAGYKVDQAEKINVGPKMGVMYRIPWMPSRPEAVRWIEFAEEIDPETFRRAEWLEFGHECWWIEVRRKGITTAAIGERLRQMGLSSLERDERAFRVEYGIIEVQSDAEVERGNLLVLWEFAFRGEFHQLTPWPELAEIASQLQAEVYYYDRDREPDPQSLSGKEMWVRVTDENASKYFQGRTAAE